MAGAIYIGRARDFSRIPPAPLKVINHRIAIDRSPLPPRGIGRMARICWPTIHADVSSIASPFFGRLVPIVTGGAEALQFAEPELVEVAMMGLDMVGDGCRHNEAASGTEGAHRLNHELIAGEPSPALAVVEVVPARLTHGFKPMATP
jgi:hypothetical protein